MPFSACASIGTFLSVAAVVLLIFAEIGQIKPTQTVPRNIRMITVDVSGLGQAAVAASGATGAVPNGFYSSANAPGGGLHQFYEWGLWNSCASQTESGSADYCGNAGFGYQLDPANTLIADVPQQYQAAVASLLPDSTFVASGYLRTWSRIAFYFIFVGGVLAVVVMIITLIGAKIAWLLGAMLAFFAAIACAVGAIIWTVIIVKLRGAVNGAVVNNNVPLGITVSYGNGLWIVWGAVAALFLSLVPFIAACCFGKRRAEREADKAELNEYRQSQYAPSSRQNSVRY